MTSLLIEEEVTQIEMRAERVAQSCCVQIIVARKEFLRSQYI